MTHAVPPGAPLAQPVPGESPAGSPLPPASRVTVHLDGREVLTFEGATALITQRSFGDHNRLVAALAAALGVATHHCPEPSELVEALRTVELMADEPQSAGAQVALGFVREAIRDAQEFFALDQPAAPLN
ncbi:hypothetical protein PUR29_36895 [Methylobacterium ajmalii]|uniref:Uncharacterized protein n=1 Tax=Methylobacterium ajmalii TaxID=2738439 RepID=A0ABV0A637_9HYPH